MTQGDIRGEGWAFPLAVSNGKVVTATDVQAINRSIEIILSTAKGERLMRPDFGTDLHNYLFKPLTEINRARMATEVKSSLAAWEPRIRVLEINVKIRNGEPAVAYIDISYQIRSSNTKANLVYPFYLKGVSQ